MKLSLWVGIYLVTLNTTEAAWAKVCRIPVTFSIFYEGPHQTPRNNPSKQNWYIYDIGANHSYTNICCWEIKIKSADNHELVLAKTFIKNRA